MTKQIISQGAEAIIELNNKVITKNRVPKSYRLPILDEKLRKQRTKKESKLIEKAGRIIPTPNLINVDEKNKKIEMQYIEGKKLSNSLDNLKNSIEICKLIGQNIAKLHDADIIHGDLTTSNMIYVDTDSKINNQNKDKKDIKQTSNNNVNKNSINDKLQTSNNNFPKTSDNKSKLYFIDFGLGYESSKSEDKAVDLHLIKQALEAKHFKNYENFFKAVMEGYKSILIIYYLFTLLATTITFHI